MKTICTLLLALTSVISSAQSHCEKDKIFVADFSIETKFVKLSVPAMSLNVGVSGVYGKGTILDNFSATVGVKAQRIITESKPGKTNEALLLIPTGTAMYKFRLDGYDSEVVHGLSVTYGTSSQPGKEKYYSVDYRCYEAPTGKSFATVGMIAGWNNYEGIHIGFTAVGFF